MLLTPREVASTLRVDLSRVYRWIDRGTIGAVQFGGARHTVRIPAAELVRLSASPKPPARRKEVPADHEAVLDVRAPSSRSKTERGVSPQLAKTKARGYGVEHKRRRRQWAPQVARGEVWCARCGDLIYPGEPWDLGHMDGDRSRYAGPEHRACNRATATHKAKQRRRRQVAYAFVELPRTVSRPW